MIDPAQMLFNPADPRVAAFAPSSRYNGLAIAKFTAPDGTIHAYVTRRVVPQPADLASAGSYVVSDHERTDLIATATMGDPELFWRLCDGNRALDPAELEVAGKRLRVTLPLGMPGGTGE
jgi:hypothetical protein